MISTAVVNYVLYTNSCYRHWTLTLGLFCSFFLYSVLFIALFIVLVQLLLLY